MVIEKTTHKKSVKPNLWKECAGCRNIIFLKELRLNLYVCPRCGHYFRLTARERIRELADESSFRERWKNLTTVDHLSFAGPPSYSAKLSEAVAKTRLKEAVITGTAKIGGCDIVIASMDFGFMGGSMGSVVGEKITRAIELATAQHKPLIIVSASGGARMHEGIFSLMQMAKTSAALARFSENNLPFISVLTHPVTGGVSASYAMLGDIIIAEPGALIGFAGPRVIEQTINQKLPDGFQLSEFLLEHGLIDAVVKRDELKNTLTKLLSILCPRPPAGNGKGCKSVKTQHSATA